MNVTVRGSADVEFELEFDLDELERIVEEQLDSHLNSSGALQFSNISIEDVDS